MAENIILPYEWKPRPYQLPTWNKLREGTPRVVTRWHRRAGKDDVFLNHTCIAAHRRVGNYWYLLPEYSQARKSMWDAINPNTGKKRLAQVFPEAIRAGTNQHEMKITLKCGSTFQLVGSDNFNSLVGSPPVGLVFSEYAISNPSSWAYLMPILEENKGWACFNSTPRGKNHFQKLCLLADSSKNWYYDTKLASDTGIFSEEQLENIRNELIHIHGPEFGEALFQQEYFCSFDAAVLGSVWGDCIEKLNFQNFIGKFDHNPIYPVHTAYDLGSSDATVIWFFQIITNEIHIIDYHESNHKSIPFYCQLLRDLAQSEGYRYGTQWLPHDARSGHLAAGGKSILQQFQAEGKANDLGKFKMVPELSVQQGIQAARATFPRCRFNEQKCEIGLEALKFYHHEYDDKKKCFGKNPAHDWSSHCFIGETKILTRHGMCQIMNLPEFGEVLTLCGWKQYINPRMTRANAQLVEVTFNDGVTVKCTPDHLFLTEYGWISAKDLMTDIVIQSSLIHSRNILMGDYTEYGRMNLIMPEVVKNCIEMFGNLRLVRFLKNVMSTIKITILRIIYYQISNVYPPQFIYQIIGKEQNIILIQKNILQKMLEKKRRIGINLMWVDYGIKEMQKECKYGRNGNVLKNLVNFAALKWTHLLENQVMHRNTVQTIANPLRIESVIKLNFTADVWCLSVPGTEHFSLENGAIVHNCADAFRYLSLVWKEARDEPDLPLDKQLERSNIASRPFKSIMQEHLKKAASKRNNL